jgi:maleate isomerase
MITPSSNTCLEPTTYRILDGTDIATAHFARIPVTRIALDDGAGNQFADGPMLEAAALLADAAVDVIAWNGTAGSWLGIGHDRELCERITAATGIPATTSTLALHDAFRAYGATRIGLAVPYTADVTEQITAVYGAAGFEVSTAAGLGLTDNLSFARVPAQDVRGLIRSAGEGEPHAIAVVCTNVSGAVHVADLEAELGIPVFDSVSATLWHTLGGAGVAGWGSLLASGSLRAELQRVCEVVLARTGADRTTLRIDLPAHALQVDLTAAEALRPGVRSIRRDASLPQRRLNTVTWLEQHRRVLVQPDFHGEPSPPQALIDVYGVQAQVLAPIVRDGAMAGWLSVHSMAERPWSGADLAAVGDAVAALHDVLDGYPEEKLT